MHAEAVNINVDEVIEAGPIAPQRALSRLMWLFVLVGLVTFTVALFTEAPAHLWGAYYATLLLFMGLAAGGVMITVIFQIVRATWSPGIRRIAEANVSFLPWAFMLFLCSYFGREALFPWARGLMPGREWWMRPDFVYLRFALLMGLLFFLMWRFVKMSLRGDVGMVRERTGGLHGWIYDHIAGGWRGLKEEVYSIQPKMSWNGPVLVACYAVIWSLFSFEMVMGMDTIWYSNMFGGFQFVGNIYIAWAILGITCIYLARISRPYSRVITTAQLWDLGKLCFGFCMLWGYMFFSQFLPQWYGNLPEETQWMILRTRDWDLPWIRLAWVTFAMCFILPFILLLSRDVKKTPKYFAAVGVIIFLGVWLEKYMIIMPQLFPERIPFNYVEVGIFLGFLGAYVLSIQSFLAKFPFVPVSSPLTKGDTKW